MEEWYAAARNAAGILGDLPAARQNTDPIAMIDAILTERQFGDDHWTLSPAKRFYYSVVRPFLPVALRPVLRRLFLAPQKEHALLRWPIEDRYVRFQYAMLDELRAITGIEHLAFTDLWPDGFRYALALTHDVESRRGVEFVREVAALEEKYGFRSAFNFVPEEYPLDSNLLGELRERGFEVGVHGLKHDGRLFLSRGGFQRRAAHINEYMRSLGASGFRAPFTHRNPVWMQELDIEYDSSFFDTDPFETIPGGTMSIWPFMLGRFVELPLTLSQDHTLVSTLRERTPRLWLEKIDFIEEHRGLAMMVTHPDYLRERTTFDVYEAFLSGMKNRSGYWHALPRDVARWWRCRATDH